MGGDRARRDGPDLPQEVTMALLAIAALWPWIFGGAIMAPVIVSLIAIALMVITGVVTWNDVIGNRQGWNVLVWFATLVAMADGLNQVGFLGWLAERSAAALAGWSAVTIAVGLIALFFVIHYLFASTTAHATAVLPAFLVTVVAVPGMPVKSGGVDHVVFSRTDGCAHAVRDRAGAGVVQRRIRRPGFLEAGRSWAPSTWWRCSQSSCRISYIIEEFGGRGPGSGIRDPIRDPIR